MVTSIRVIPGQRGFLGIGYSSISVWLGTEDEWHAKQESARHLALGVDHSQAQEVAAAYGKHQILGPSERRKVAAAASGLNPINGQKAQARWDRLLAMGTQKPGSLGFVSVGDHGTISLAAKLDAPDGTISKMLDRLHGEALIHTYAHHTPGRRPRLVCVQIPLLTDSLVWLAQRRHWDIGGLGSGKTMRSSTALDVVRAALARKLAPPDTLATEADVEKWLRRLNRLQ